MEEILVSCLTRRSFTTPYFGSVCYFTHTQLIPYIILCKSLRVSLGLYEETGGKKAVLNTKGGHIYLIEVN